MWVERRVRVGLFGGTGDEERVDKQRVEEDDKGRLPLY